MRVIRIVLGMGSGVASERRRESIILKRTDLFGERKTLVGLFSCWRKKAAWNR